MQQREAAKESTEEGKKRAHRRFNDAVLILSKAFALAAASDEARDIRDEVGFFQTVRAALAKSTPSAGKSSAERDRAVQQIVSRAVVSTEIVDILEAAGMETPDISILSDEFLAEVQGMEKKNLAMEALRKLINGQIRSQSRINVVQTRAFSDRLEEAIARYHTNAITTAEVIQELINLAKDIRAAHQRGEEEGLTQDEISFYDALAENESAVDLLWVTPIQELRVHPPMSFWISPRQEYPLIQSRTPPPPWARARCLHTLANGYSCCPDASFSLKAPPPQGPDQMMLSFPEEP